MHLRHNATTICMATPCHKIFFCFWRNRALQIFLLSATLFLLISFNFERSEHPFNLTSHTCNNRASWEWSEMLVPGQVRTVRTKTNGTLHSKNPRKTILLWTTYFSEEYSDDFYFFQKGRQTFDRYNCEMNNCYVTSNKSLLPYVDAVLFHARDLNSSDIPKRNRKNQIWILYSMEPPRYVWLKWHSIRYLFNWTMTYRKDSDVQVKYGEFNLNSNSCRGSSKQRNKNISKTKNGAVWMVSNCRTESRREAYVKELRKYFEVDVYGKCNSRKTCRPTQSEVCYQLLNNYKYYLSFENSICQDYVTEKFFNVLMYDVVPVVFGGAHYADIAPLHSFIDATKFSNPKHLADHLTAVANNSSWYSSFLSWKERYTVHLHPWVCDLCERLHHLNSENNAFSRDLWKWWVPGASCRRWTKRKGFHNIF